MAEVGDRAGTSPVLEQRDSGQERAFMGACRSPGAHFHGKLGGADLGTQ